MVLPNLFNDTASKPLQSYDYFDLASGQGYKKLYLGLSRDTSTTTPFLNSQVMDSNTRFRQKDFASATGDSAWFDDDFDLTFTSPQIVSGKIYFNNTVLALNGGTGTTTTWIVVNVYHVTSGGTETLLGTVESPHASFGGSAGQTAQRDNLFIDLGTKYFVIGEKLRINVILHGTKTGTGTGSSYIYYDNTNTLTVQTTGASYSELSDFFGNVPFKIDI